ncbi:HAD-like domain-containing protein [Xylariomycetidae sp. FL2044]|nr:HAD-like domain-containing protein [Xylariomycetidae sp. FL2044]
MPPIKSILFDCDNTLVLSEDIAFEGCAQLANEILAAHDFPPTPGNRYDGPTLMHAFVGLNFRGLMRRLQERHGFAMTEAEEDGYVARELDAICRNLREKCQPCEGVDAVLEKLQGEGKYGMAIVSSSAMPRVEASIKKVGQDRYFPEGKVFSAASSLDPPSSKPDPKIYLFACEKLGVEPGQCVAIEDSRSGEFSSWGFFFFPFLFLLLLFLPKSFFSEPRDERAAALVERYGVINK